MNWVSDQTLATWGSGTSVSGTARGRATSHRGQGLLHQEALRHQRGHVCSQPPSCGRLANLRSKLRAFGGQPPTRDGGQVWPLTQFFSFFLLVKNH